MARRISRGVRAVQPYLYPEETQRDPILRFVRFLESYVEPHHTVLDIGAGAGKNNVYDFKGKVTEMVGVDLDPRVVDNPLLDRGLEVDGRTLPFEDDTFDVVFSIYVLEHVANPDEFAGEIARVLKPGGVVLGLTPNKYHYVSLIASVTSTAFHKTLNEWRGRKSTDTFPTTYLLNTFADQRRYFDPARFEVDQYVTFECQPNYLTQFLPAFLVGAVYERVVNALGLFSGIRVNIMSAFRRTA